MPRGHDRGMSEQGWREFLAADGVDDLVIFADRAGRKVCVCAWPDHGDVG